MSAPPEKIPVVFVVGSGHSGSTLLGLLLGQHSHIADVGEISHYHRWSEIGDLCACGKTVAACPFWSEVFRGNDYAPLLYRHLGAFLVGSSDYRAAIEGKDAPLDVPRYIRDMESAYEKVLALSGKKIIVDVSKSADRAELLMRHSSRIHPVLIHLVRDGRGVVYSNVKVGRSASVETRKWLSSNLKAQIVRMRNPHVRSLRMRYEDLALDTEGQMRKLSAVLGIPFEPSTLGYQLEGLHIVSGNPRFHAEDRTIQIDLSWKTGLSQSDRLSFDFLAGWLNVLYESRLSKKGQKS